MSKSNDRKLRFGIIFWLLMAVAFVLLASATFFLIMKSSWLNHWDKSAHVGDTFGILNTIFSGLAFAVIVISIFYQRQELENQFEELRYQREEMVNQREEMKMARHEQVLNRVTSLIYEQMRRADHLLNDFQMRPNRYESEEKGYAAVRRFNRVCADILSLSLDNPGQPNSFKLIQISQWIDNMSLSDGQVFYFTNQIWLNAKAVESVLKNANLESYEKMQLKKLYLNSTFPKYLRDAFHSFHLVMPLIREVHKNPKGSMHESTLMLLMEVDFFISELLDMAQNTLANSTES